ncbi:MAG: hypothetical protein U0359_14305 [Byssovorax sp.]
MRRSGPTLTLPALSLVAVVALAACTTTTDTTTASSGSVASALAVDPADFLGKVACSAQPGGMRSFVATATDVTDPAHPLTLGSSSPTPCSQSALFRYIQIGHVYVAEVDAYEEAAGDLTPLADASSGSRHMVLRNPPEGQAGAIVAPRWTTDCGVAGVTAVDDERIPFRPCDALVDHRAEPPATAITVDPRVTLGFLTCKPSGTVFAFDVIPEQPSLSPVKGLACGGSAAQFTDGVSAGAAYSFKVHAYLFGDPSPAYEATCQAHAKAGIDTAADCTLLAPIEPPG